MPRQAKPARLWLRPADKDRDSIWLVLHRGKQISTGCGKDDNEGAEKFFQEYLAKQFSLAPKPKQRPAEEIFVAEVVATYLKVKGEAVARPKALAQRMDAVLDFWGEKTLADISRVTCKEYEDQRGSSAAARRELEDLRSAVNMAIADGVCRHMIKVTVPEPPPKRTTFLQPEQVAQLLWRAYRFRQTFKGEPTKYHPTPARSPLHYLRGVYWQPVSAHLAGLLRKGRGAAICRRRKWPLPPHLAWRERAGE
ncbi:hypothetical protein ABIF63_005319 [Bradyrhizobium japonicum]|uniref:Core-binding (CB) domain-containing protein n=1 Tax=Bradyrhizobium japonicum TaxID=375 RepID=A0ABV2RW99_BRAJP|nr:hypothetical protein [Bradyrhizobium japonicum]UQD95629.1 hypothetical protein JEY30_29020 [Bradyrhizobium japonicum]WLB23043.1 hypothetical protein QIH95_20205 [Bradyrhizobium japonicum]